MCRFARPNQLAFRGPVRSAPGLIVFIVLPLFTREDLPPLRSSVPPIDSTHTLSFPCLRCRDRPINTVQASLSDPSLPRRADISEGSGMADDGAAQDDAVSGGLGQLMPGMRPSSPLPSASHHPDPLMPVAENWCHTQVGPPSVSFSR